MDKLITDLQKKIDLKTKPPGALGCLEALAMQIGKIQQTLNPELVSPHILVFAGDHGIASKGVSAYPQEVTYQMVYNFLQEGAAINVFAKQNKIALKIIDAGVNHQFVSSPLLTHAKIAYGTKCFLNGESMTAEELQQCFSQAALLIEGVSQSGCNIIGFGEMGIGNTSSATMIMAYLCDLPLAECTGTGTGLNKENLAHKLKVLEEARDYHGAIDDPMQVLQTFAGFEVAQMCAAMLAAYEKKMILMIDGFIASSALLAASKIKPAIMDSAVFCHQSDEYGHKKLLQYLNSRPLLHLGMRLGEGTGCAVAYPIIQSAVNFLNLMASFDGAGISNKE